MTRMRTPGSNVGPNYQDLHAIVVDASRLITSGQTLEEAAHEVLIRLRTSGVVLPPRR